MRHIFTNNRIYFVTCESLSSGRSDEEMVEAVLSGGVRTIQFRDKVSPRDRLLKKAVQLREITSRYQAVLIINDDPELALESGADGVHLGQDDFPVKEVRKMRHQHRSGKELIIGLSTHNLTEVKEASTLPVDYINLGPVFPTPTKKNQYSPLVGGRGDGSHDFAPLQEMIYLCRELNLSFTVMGGIKEDHLISLAKLGATHFAMVTALSLHPDPKQQASHLIDLAQQAVSQSKNEIAHRDQIKTSQEVGA